jgi:hypothetical protein
VELTSVVTGGDAAGSRGQRAGHGAGRPDGIPDPNLTAVVVAGLLSPMHPVAAEAAGGGKARWQWSRCDHELGDPLDRAGNG